MNDHDARFWANAITSAVLCLIAVCIGAMAECSGPEQVDMDGSGEFVRAGIDAKEQR